VDRENNKNAIANEPSFATTCCFTGHRQLPPADVEIIQQRLYRRIARYHAEGIRTFYAGGALGFDMLAAIAVLNSKIDYPDLSLHLALPCRDHDARWPLTQRQILRRLIDKADSITYTSETYSRACMHARNRFMVDHSLHCLCYLENKSRGGTASTVQYALSHNRIIDNLYEDNTPLQDLPRSSPYTC